MRSGLQLCERRRLSKIAIVLSLASLGAGCSAGAVRVNGPPMLAGSTGLQPVATNPVEQRELPGLEPTAGQLSSDLAARGWTLEGAPTVDVGPADTATSLSKGFGVPVSVILEANGLQREDEVRPGLRLVIPTYDYRNPQSATQTTPPTPPEAGAPLGAPPTSLDAQAREGRHVVQEGETLYSIARSHRVPIAEVATLNGLPTDHTVKIGQTLRIPSPDLPGQGEIPPSAIAEAPSQPQTQELSEAPAALPEVGGSAGGSDEPQVSEVAGFRWPVQGRILTGFGKQADGARNDGINLAVPAGTPVHAAQSGTVIYAGDELEGYGNLVLVQHDDDWVSAYAHNERLKVSRGDKVSRGQPIAAVGASGSVIQPQLHFELRKKSKPVDPLPHLTGGA